jgi:hypothetical protein
VTIQVTFDRVFKATDGAVLGVTMIAYDDPVTYSAVNIDLKKGFEINEFHKMLGHCGSDRLKKTANIHGFKLIGEYKTCEECAIAKLDRRMLRKSGRDEVRSLKTGSSLILVPLKMEALVDPNFGSLLSITVQIIVGVYF